MKKFCLLLLVFISCLDVKSQSAEIRANNSSISFEQIVGGLKNPWGMAFLPNGDMLVTLNLGWIGRGESGSKWRGWMLKVTEEGIVTPYATGLRSPAGFSLHKVQRKAEA